MWQMSPNSKVKIGFRMSTFYIWPELECQNRISSGKIRYSDPVQMSKYDFKCHIWPKFECQKRDFECLNEIFGFSLNVKIGFRMAKCDIRPNFKWQNRLPNVEMWYSARNRKFLPKLECKKQDRECQNTIFAPNSNVKIKFWMSKWDIRPQFEYEK